MFAAHVHIHGDCLPAWTHSAPRGTHQQLNPPRAWTAVVCTTSVRANVVVFFFNGFTGNSVLQSTYYNSSTSCDMHVCVSVCVVCQNFSMENMVAANNDYMYN